MTNSSSDGFNEVRIATLLLWAGVVFGLGVIAARFYAIDVLTNGAAASAGGTMLVAGLIFIVVQARLIMQLAAGRGAVRGRILAITLIRIALYVPGYQEMMQVMPALLIIPMISALVQFSALILLYTPPGSDWFATHSGRRRA